MEKIENSLSENEESDLNLFALRCRIFAWVNALSGIFAFLGTLIHSVNMDVDVMTSSGWPFQVAFVQMLLMILMSRLIISVANKSDAYVLGPTTEVLYGVFRKIILVFGLYIIELLVFVVVLGQYIFEI